MKWFISIIFNILQPSCWMRNHSYCKYWDAEINKQLDNPVFTEFSKHTVKLNGTNIWVANYPYSYGNAMDNSESLPSRQTVRRLRGLHLKAFAENNFK